MRPADLPFLGIVFLFLCNAGWSDPLIVAHRGASHDAPENTLPAFELAWEQGADVIEGDFLLTKDNRIVCIHDRSTKRLADRNLAVRESTLKELRELDVGSWKHEKYKGTKIPTIAEVFATIPKGKKIFVEVKCGPEIIPYLVKEIGKCKLKTEQVVLICFKQSVVKAFKQALPKNKAYWLSSFKKNSEGVWEPSLETVLATLKDTKADGLDSHRDIPGEAANKIMKAGYEWHAWTVNDLATAKRLQTLGIHSITTDRPALIKSSL
jgi:glycerophosphoryl diester phosphodiesterase